jgi:hypothetical protein
VTTAEEDLSPLDVGPRGERLVHRVDLVSAGAVTLLASVAYLVAILTQIQPTRGFAVTLFTIAPAAGAVATAILWYTGRTFNDPLLRWYAVGLVTAVVAMVLQLISFPVVSRQGGPFGTGGDSSAALYLLFHLAPALAAGAGVLRLASSWARPITVAGVVLALLLALDLLPLPLLLRPDGSYSTALLVLEGITALVILVAAAVWTRAVGRAPSALHAWVSVSLMLSFTDVLLNLLAAERFSPVWWSSLSMRAATYAVLAGGCLVWLLQSLGTAERYTEQELSRREGQLGVAFGLTRRLLEVSERLSLTVSLDDVKESLVDLARTGTGMTAGVLHVPGPGAQDPSPALASMIAAHTPTTGLVLASSRAELVHLLPGAQVPREVGAGALVPIGLGRDTAWLALWSATEHRWPQDATPFLAGLADQGGQALQRALSYEAMARAATTLQESLLPARLPEPEGLRLLSAYRPLTEHTQVGGDWFDCVEVGDHHVALVIGDVMGKGLRAAAVMGQVRVAMRTAIGYDPSPTAVLRALDGDALDLEEDEIVTLTYGLLDLSTGQLAVARAGHPPVLIARPDAPVETLVDGGSPPIGVPVASRAEVWTQLEPGSALVLYTDGLVESRTESLDVGIEATARHVEALHAAAEGRHAAWQGWLDDVAARSGWQDDVAVLIALYR